MVLYKFTKEIGGKETPVLGDCGKTPGEQKQLSHQPNLAGRQQGAALCHTQRVLLNSHRAQPSTAEHSLMCGCHWIK